MFTQIMASWPPLSHTNISSVNHMISGIPKIFILLLINIVNDDIYRHIVQLQYKIFILKISLTKILLTAIGKLDTHDWLCLTLASSERSVLTLPALSADVVLEMVASSLGLSIHSVRGNKGHSASLLSLILYSNNSKL